MNSNSNKVIIRIAQQGDETAIAKVHIQSWQETYKGLAPQAYLDEMPSQLNEKINNWKKSLANSERITFVAENKQGVVGFVLFGPPRDPDRVDFIELGAIYLLASEKGKGIGFSLVSAGFNRLKDLGFKKAYCWVLEGNSTNKFYERTGARFFGQTKYDEIGGQQCKELAYEWKSLDIGDYNWKPLSVDEVKKVFAPFKQRWWIAGGWAIDLFLKKQTRPHDDIDIIIQRKDQLEVQDLLEGWDLWAADPPGTLKPWGKGEFLKKGLQDIWGRKTSNDPWQIQIMLFDSENGDWVFKRDESVRRSLESVTITTDDGLFLLAPEVQLLYKSKSLRDKDKLDFENVLLAMDQKQKSWLRQVLIQVYDNSHEWIEKLGDNLE